MKAAASNWGRNAGIPWGVIVMTPCFMRGIKSAAALTLLWLHDDE
jgi:hypothetical protein